MMLYILFFLALLWDKAFLVESVAADTNENCDFWASSGECEKNPAWMLANCATSCVKYTDTSSSLPIPMSFYDIVEKDLQGNELRFDKFRGLVVYVVNVASHCGYTAENYNTFQRLKNYREQGFEMVLAPCNQFGFQEPGDATAIANFAKRQSFEGIILAKADVNGHATRPVFAYLKAMTNKNHINWNFDGKFLIDKEGNVEIPSDNVESDIQRLLGGGEL